MLRNPTHSPEERREQMQEHEEEQVILRELGADRFDKGGRADPG